MVNTMIIDNEIIDKTIIAEAESIISNAAEDYVAQTQTYIPLLDKNAKRIASRGIMKVYEVHYDNMEAWEDNFFCAECFYSTYEGAVKYLEEEMGLIKDVAYDGKPVWNCPKFVCSMNNIDCEDCEKNDDEDECEEWFDRFDSEHYHPQWTIVEWEVRE